MKTAVEWLMEEISVIDWQDPYWKIKLEQAKELEKEQIKSAYQRGKKYKKPLKDSNPIKY